MCNRGQPGACPRNEECGSSHLGLPGDIRIPWRRIAVIQRADTVRPGSLSQTWKSSVMYLKVSTSQSDLLRRLTMWLLTSVGTGSTKAHTIYATVFKVSFFPLYSSVPLVRAFDHTLSQSVTSQFQSHASNTGPHFSRLPFSNTPAQSAGSRDKSVLRVNVSIFINISATLASIGRNRTIVLPLPLHRERNDIEC